jgi:hemoglobin
MTTSRDITMPEDIRKLVHDFYRRLLADPLVKHHFEPLDLPSHLPRVEAFWNMVVFGGPADGAMMAKHFAHHRATPILPGHLDRWLEHFIATVEEHFSGPIAEEVKLRARTMIAVMRVKIPTA